MPISENKPFIIVLAVLALPNLSDVVQLLVNESTILVISTEIGSHISGAFRIIPIIRVIAEIMSELVIIVFISF